MLAHSWNSVPGRLSPTPTYLAAPTPTENLWCLKRGFHQVRRTEPSGHVNLLKMRLCRSLRLYAVSNGSTMLMTFGFAAIIIAIKFLIGSVIGLVIADEWKDLEQQHVVRL
jgi:hypothetical protein